MKELAKVREKDPRGEGVGAAVSPALRYGVMRPFLGCDSDFGIKDGSARWPPADDWLPALGHGRVGLR